MGRVLAAPELPGAPGLESRRAELLARGKGEPVLFLRAPRQEPASGEAAIHRAEIARSPSPGWTLSRNYPRLINRPELAREVLLREGYLYAESPALAASLVQHVEVHHLYGDPVVVIERGAERLRARKGSSFWYVYEDGPERGARARVMLFDRLFPEGKEPGPRHHVELRRLAVRLGFDSMKIARLTERGILADLRYGSQVVRSLLDISDASADLACELVPNGAEQAVAAARDLARRRQRVLDVKRRAIVAQIEESLPFDEPRTEIGQQDGNLRPAWIWAYNHGWDSYSFNDDHYMVFDTAGRPKIPQVCIDFITDTLERASGTWWRARPEERQRIKGLLDFEELALDNRRSVERFVNFAKQHPEWFDVLDLEWEERVPFFERERFYAHLLEHRERYLPGDVVVIHGPRPNGDVAYHSFWIYDADPVTGMPTLVAANAGRPRIRTWEFEMRSSPRRSIRHRIRPRLGWLETILPLDEERTAVAPPPLASAPI
jgi:hypothetical protein